MDTRNPHLPAGFAETMSSFKKLCDVMKELGEMEERREKERREAEFRVYQDEVRRVQGTIKELNAILPRLRYQ